MVFPRDRPKTTTAPTSLSGVWEPFPALHQELKFILQTVAYAGSIQAIFRNPRYQIVLYKSMTYYEHIEFHRAR